MSYYSYSNQQVFLDNNVNAICDTIISNIINQFTAPTVHANFCVSGSVSKIIQGASNVPIPCVAFRVSDIDIYNYLRININQFVSVIYAHMFSDRFQVVNMHCYFEFWFSEDPLNIINSSSIYVEDVADIPSNIL